MSVDVKVTPVTRFTYEGSCRTYETEEEAKTSAFVDVAMKRVSLEMSMVDGQVSAAKKSLVENYELTFREVLSIAAKEWGLI